MTREDTHEPLSLDKRFHKGGVGAGVVAVVVAVADIALMADQFFVKAWCSGWIATLVLVGSGRMDRDVYERETRNHAALLLTDCVAGKTEPGRHLVDRSVTGRIASTEPAGKGTWRPCAMTETFMAGD
mgnify:CR=1 FL=1